MSIQRLKNLSSLRLLFTHPYIFWVKVGKKFKVIFRDFFIDQPTRRFIKHNNKVWKGWVNLNSVKVVLVDWHSLPAWNIPGLLFANILAKKKGARICSFSRERWWRARAVHALYRSFNILEHVAMNQLTRSQQERRDKIYVEVLKELKTKADVFHLKVNGYHLGIDIYESYLKEFNKPTVALDELLFVLVRQAIGFLIFWEDYFDHNEVAGVVISHDSYVECNVVCRVAYKRGIPVYLPLGSFVSLLKSQHDSYGYFYSLRKWFQVLSEGEKKQAKELARIQLEKRFRGEVTTEMFYKGVKKGSAFHLSDKSSRVIRPSNKIKVLICPHCFYDSPHSYGGMLFLDFYEWFKFLVQLAEKTDYDWYFKVHPNPLPGTLEHIKGILGSSSRIMILPLDISHHQLVAEGINFVLTVYGSVGHEYPALGVQVINAGYNPHAAYDFTWTPKSLSEYEHFLLNLKELKKDINVDELYEFYYMYYYYCLVDDLVYHSFRELLFSGPVVEWSVRSEVYSFYLNGWNQKRHQESIRRMEEFIDSGKQHLFSKGPVDVEEFPPPDTDYLS